MRRWAGTVSLAATILAAPFGASDPGVKAPSLSRLYSDSGDGGYRVVWRAQVGSGADARYAIFTRTVNSHGRPDSRPRRLVDPGPHGFALTPAVNVGKLVWVGRRPGRQWAVYARRVDVGHGRPGRVYRVSRYYPSEPGPPAILFQISNKNFLVAWAGPRHRGIRARTLTYEGRPRGSKELTVASHTQRVSNPTLANRQAGFEVVVWTLPTRHDPRIHARLVRTGHVHLNRPRAVPGISPHRVVRSSGHLSAVATDPSVTFDHLVNQNFGVAWTVKVRDASGRRASAIVAEPLDVEARHRLGRPMVVARGRDVHEPRLAFRNRSQLYDLVWARTTGTAGCGSGTVERALLRSQPWSMRPFKRTVLSDAGGCAPRGPTLPEVDPSAGFGGRVLYAWEQGRVIEGTVR